MSDKGKEVPLDSESERSMQEAIDFANELKIRFTREEHKYRTFLDLLNGYREGKTSKDDMQQEVSLLLRDQPDMISWFTSFLPDESYSKSDTKTERGSTSGHK